jgi:putative DNA primase/helicase
MRAAIPQGIRPLSAVRFDFMSDSDRMGRMSAQAFIAAASARGLLIDHASTDGKIHRVPVEGRAKAERPGWYVLDTSADGRMFGAFGRWDDGREADTWHSGDASKPLNKTELAAITEARAGAAKQREKEQRNSAKAANAQWEAFAIEGESPYLTRKHVGALGVRFDGAAVCVPLRDADSALWSFQRIAPDGEKRFFPGGRIAGCFHLIGEVRDDAPLLICEGFATGATLHEATGAAVACAMNCHNIGPVCDALHKRYPKARLLICADDDARTERERGNNPGVQCATDAAKRIKCGWIKPEGLPEGATDFNDLAAHCGMDEVRAQLSSALAEKGAAKSSESEAKSKSAKLPRFEVNDEGVWHFGTDREGKALAPLWICAPLRITALTRDGEGAEWGYLLEFSDPEGEPHAWAMPARMLSGDGNEYRQHLLSLGLQIASSAAAKERLTHYIQTRKPETLARCTDRAGWHDSLFVMPERTLGQSEERVIFQTSGGVSNTFREAGSLDLWRAKVSAFCAGNSRLVFAVSSSFAGPTLHLTGMESGGFHFRGGSSSGKTTALRAAASVFGGADFMQRWRATDNALESMAALHSDATLILDELSQVEPRVAGDCAYLLSNGQGKARMSRTGTARQSLRWRLVFLSAGEVSLADHMLEGGKRTRTGQEIRLADIPADAGKSLGIFEELHGAEDGARFANTLNANAAKHYGIAGRMFIERLASERDAAKAALKMHMQTFMQKMREHGAEGQAQRVAARFAQVGAAGELATEWGLTGWPEGMALQSAERCYRAWLSARGGLGNAEERDMIRQVKEFLERYGESRFTHYALAEKADDHMPDTVNRAGFKRYTSEATDAAYEFYVLPEVFKHDMCKGFDYREVARVLRARGFIKTDEGRLTLTHRLPMFGKTRCYLVLPAIFEHEGEGEASDAA